MTEADGWQLDLTPAHRVEEDATEAAAIRTPIPRRRSVTVAMVVEALSGVTTSVDRLGHRLETIEEVLRIRQGDEARPAEA